MSKTHRKYENEMSRLSEDDDWIDPVDMLLIQLGTAGPDDAEVQAALDRLSDEEYCAWLKRVCVKEKPLVRQHDELVHLLLTRLAATNLTERQLEPALDRLRDEGYRAWLQSVCEKLRGLRHTH